MLDDERFQSPQDADDASVALSSDGQGEAEQNNPGALLQAAHYLADAIQTEAVQNELDAVSSDCADLRERITADLQQAQTKITEAILDIRRGVAPAVGSIAGTIVSSQLEKAAGYVDRILSGRSETTSDTTLKK